MSATRVCRVFISAVSGELKSYRTEVARALRRKELEVRDQEHFRQGPATLLQQLAAYIKKCDAVILLIGDEAGEFPSDDHASALGGIPIYEQYCNEAGQIRASYTQWEFLLAKHHGKQTYVFFTGEGFAPDNPNNETHDVQSCQTAYRHWIDRKGEHRDSLKTLAKLIEDVLVLSFTDLSRSAQPVDLSWRASGRKYKSQEQNGLVLPGPAPKAAELRRAFERDLSEVAGTHVYVDGITKSIPADLLESALQACWDFLGRFSEIRRGADFKAISPALEAVVKLAKRAKSHGIKLADYLLFSACDTLVHCRCYVDPPGILRRNTDEFLSEMRDVVKQHRDDTSLQRAYLARLGDRDKTEAGTDILKRAAVSKCLEEVRDVPFVPGTKLPYYAIRTRVTFAGCNQNISDTDFDDVLRQTKSDMFQNRLTLHEIAHVWDGMSDGCALRFMMCQLERRDGSRYHDLALGYFGKAIDALRAAERELGPHPEYEVRVERLSLTLCLAGIYDHLTPHGMPRKDLLEAEGQRVLDVARKNSTDRVEMQAQAFLDKIRRESR